MDYFYSQEIRRLVLQFIRAFSGFEVKTSKGMRQIPIRWGTPDRMVSYIMKQNSENKILYTPFMSVHITAINMAPDRRQSPSFISTKLVDERVFNEGSCEYSPQMGDRFTVMRHMGVPYNFTFQIDIWTSNEDQKMQLLEQIMMLFNPSVDLQTSDNPLDWTAITYITMEDNIVYTTRSVPLGTEESMNTASLSFSVPYWINPPAAVIRRQAIETIIANTRAVSELPIDDSDFEWSGGQLLSQQIITPGNHAIHIEGVNITLLGSNGIPTDDFGNTYDWFKLLEKYSDFRPTRTNNLIVKRKFGDPNGVVGQISFPNVDKNKIVWTMDDKSIPAETLEPVNAIIDPTKQFPENGLPAASDGQRYLMGNDMFYGGVDTSPLGIWGIQAKVNDVIEYNGNRWVIAFDSASQNAHNIQIIKNSFTNKLFRWIPDKQLWEFAIDGVYKAGTWKIQNGVKR